ncbi:MAG: sugar-binding domain-containing protein [Promethearchaeota archaeon]
MMKYSLNGKWNFKKQSNSDIEKTWWEPNWIEKNYENMKNITLPIRKNIIPELREFSGIIWFFHEFTEIPSYSTRFDLYLQFKAANYHTKVWINGVLLGENEGGFLPFKFEVISEILNLGEKNYLTVRVENFKRKGDILFESDKELDSLNWRGIIRNIDFLILDKTRIEQVTVNPTINNKNMALLDVLCTTIDKSEKKSTLEIIWNLYFIGNIMEKKIDLEENISAEFQTSDNNDLIIPDEIHPIEELSELSEETEEFDIIDDLIREPITEEDFKSVKNSDTRQIIAPEGVLIKSGTFIISGEETQANFLIELNDPKYWSPITPELYSLEIELKGTECKKFVRFGIRGITIRKRNFYINNKQIIINDIDFKEENMFSNNNILTEKNIMKKLKNIRASGFNTIVGFIHDEFLYNMTDEIGLLVIQTVPFPNLGLIKIRKLIELYYNHPSLIIWCFLKKVYKKGKKLEKRFRTRPIISLNKDQRKPIGQIFPKKF